MTHLKAAGLSWRRLALVLTATILILALRQPDKLLFPQFWAEDAPIFYAEAARSGVGSLARPYNGYFHAYPRLVSVVGTVTPIFYIPALYVLGALAAALAAMAAVVTGGITARPWTQAGLVVGALLTPYSGEVWLVLTNVQWVLGALLVAVLASRRPGTRGAQILFAAAAATIAVTGPFSLLLWPIAALRMWHWRDRWSAVLLALVASGAAVSAYALSQHPRTDEVLGFSERLLTLVHIAAARPRLALAALAACLLLMWAFVTGLRRADWPLVACASCGLLVGLGTVAGLPAVQLLGLPGRYMFVPWICTAWSLLLLLERGHRAALAPLVVMLALAASHFSIAAEKRHDWRSDARCLETRAFCNVVVNPGWPVGLPGRGTE